MKAFFDKLDAMTFAPFTVDETAVLLALLFVVVGGFLWLAAMALGGMRR